MISGIVTSNLEATVCLHIIDGNGQSQAIDAVIDTGFAGFMSLPIPLVVRLGLPQMYQDKIQLIDGRILFVNIYSATVIWNRRTRLINVQAIGNSALIGMAMLAAHDLHIRVTDGGTVSIDALP